MPKTGNEEVDSYEVVVKLSPSPLVFYYLNWRNPYIRELKFTAGIMSYAKRKK